MEKLNIANKRLKTAHDDVERSYKALIDKLDGKEEELSKRLADIDRRKLETADANGNADAADDDVIEINAGGKVVAAKRSTLTQLRGTRLEALFGGRWDRQLQRDGSGRIFLDVSPLGFQAIVDYLNELTISSEDAPPEPPSVDGEYQHILSHQLELFGVRVTKIPESNILNKTNQVDCLHDWLGEDGSDGEFRLLYRGSRDGYSDERFHSKCDNLGSTLTIMRATRLDETGEYVLGAYSNTPWSRNYVGYQSANRAFLFVLYGSDVSSPYKMKLRNSNDNKAVCTRGYYGSPDYSARGGDRGGLRGGSRLRAQGGLFGTGPSSAISYGPTFGEGHDLLTDMRGRMVHLKFGATYESGPSQLLDPCLKIQEFEVFQVTGNTLGSTKKMGARDMLSQFQPVDAFSGEVNKAINSKQESLAELEAEILHLEESFEDEANFVTSFAAGDQKDVVRLNVSGTIMVTKRSTLCIAGDSVLARQFDDSKWTAQGCGNLRVKEWSPDDVTSWVRKIDGVPAEAADAFAENEITGRELLALKKDGLTMLGIARTGTLCLLLEEIELLKKASQDVVTLVEHSPYCFGKILDYLRLKRIHSQGLVGEPALPQVCDSQKGRFDKVVKYFFPGASSKFILG